MTEEATIDVYECFFYRGIGVKFCKYYPKGCYSCGELIKTGEEKMIETNYIPHKLLLAGYENLSWIGKLHWNYCEIKHRILCFLKNGIVVNAERKRK